MRLVLLGLGAAVLALSVVGGPSVALAVARPVTLLADCAIPECGQPQGPEGVIAFVLVAVVGMVMAVAEARRH